MAIRANSMMEDDIEMGCTNVSKTLGFRKMPPGYHLMLDSDQVYYYWLNDQGEHSAIHWDKWAIYRWAVCHFGDRQSIQC